MTVLSWIAAGIWVGVLNGMTIWWVVDALDAQTSRSLALAQTLGSAGLRFLFAALLLVLALREGLLAGLLAFAGLWLARLGMLYKLYRGRSFAHQDSQALDIKRVIYG